MKSGVGITTHFFRSTIKTVSPSSTSCTQRRAHTHTGHTGTGGLPVPCWAGEQAGELHKDPGTQQQQLRIDFFGLPALCDSRKGPALSSSLPHFVCGLLSGRPLLPLSERVGFSTPSTPLWSCSSELRGRSHVAAQLLGELSKIAPSSTSGTFPGLSLPAPHRLYRGPTSVAVPRSFGSNERVEARLQQPPSASDGWGSAVRW